MDPTLVKAGLRPPPPAAAALTRVGSIDSSRRQHFDGQERASRGPPTHSKKREPRTFPLDKKVPIQGTGHGKLLIELEAYACTLDMAYACILSIPRPGLIFGASLRLTRGE